MPVIVDGQNLLHAARRTEGRQQLSRAGLCNLLAEWAEKHAEQLGIVFDGSPPRRRSLRQPSGRVHVAFSGPGRTADEVLIQHIDESSAPRRLLVVSSDRQIQKAAKRRRCRRAGSDAFCRMVLRQLAEPIKRPSEPAEKHEGLSPDQARDWLKEFGIDST